MKIGAKMKMLNLIKKGIVIYLIYAFITAIVIFKFNKNNMTSSYDDSVERFYSEEEGQDRVVLVENRESSGIARINLIENAKESLDISYYVIEEGISSTIFYGEIFKAADRGVKVRILIDGILHNFRGRQRGSRYAFANHPNIELKFFEPFNLAKPWTWNNRLHDKYIIADNKLAMLGGRNIGDRYFLREDSRDIVYDRDVLVINTDINNYEDSAISQIQTYFNDTWNYRYSKEPFKILKEYQKKWGIKKEEELKKEIEKIHISSPEIFNRDIDWYECSSPTNKVSLIHNPIGRFNKEPKILKDIVELIKDAKESVFIQSPYIIPTKDMKKHINHDDVLSKEITILTNSFKSSPNLPAISGYSINRKEIVDNSDYVYEYHGEGSLHGKSYIIDDRVSLIGSFNLDSRSSFLHTETMMVIDSKDFVQVLERELGHLKDLSLLVGEDYKYKNNPLMEEEKTPIIKMIIIKVLSPFIYLFDYLV